MKTILVNMIRKSPNNRLKPFLSSAKEKYTAGKELLNLAVQRKKLLRYTFLQHLGMVAEKS